MNLYQQHEIFAAVYMEPGTKCSLSGVGTGVNNAFELGVEYVHLTVKFPYFIHFCALTFILIIAFVVCQRNISKQIETAELESGLQQKM